MGHSPIRGRSWRFCFPCPYSLVFWRLPEIAWTHEPVHRAKDQSLSEGIPP
jgi:hypothetical protein